MISASEQSNTGNFNSSHSAENERELGMKMREAVERERREELQFREAAERVLQAKFCALAAEVACAAEPPQLAISAPELVDVEFGQKAMERVLVPHERFRIFAVTSAGGPRSKHGFENQDAFVVYADGKKGGVAQGVIGVFDGIGGSENGKLASRAASVGLTERVVRPVMTTDEAQSGYDGAYEAVGKYGLAGETTGAAVFYADNVDSAPFPGAIKTEYRKICMFAVGDCKALTVRNGKILEAGTTVLQNRAQEDILRQNVESKDLYVHPGLRKPTHSFGSSYEGYGVQKKEFEAQKGDVIVVASDALWDNVSEYEIARLLEASGAGFEEKLYELVYERNNTDKPFRIRHDAQTVVEKSLPAGDNITIAVLRVA